MGANSKIEWTHNTFNPWRGCTKVSAGCANCYAEAMSGRNNAVLGEWGPKGTRVIASESMWSEPRKWNAKVPSDGIRRRVFCASLADVFEAEDTMPALSWEPVERARLRLLNLIRETPLLDWLLLTKRPEAIIPTLHRMHRRALAIEDGGILSGWIERWLNGRSVPDNVWVGTSVEDQATAETRTPYLLGVPARRRFLSMEPLLGPVNLTRLQDDELGGYWSALDGLGDGIHWVIVGGESGAKARPMHPAWVESIRDQCRDAGVPFFFKQWGEYAPHDTGFSHRVSLVPIRGHTGREATREELWAGAMMYRSGKSLAGRTLDGRTWDEVPV